MLSKCLQLVLISLEAVLRYLRRDWFWFLSPPLLILSLSDNEVIIQGFLTAAGCGWHFDVSGLSSNSKFKRAEKQVSWDLLLVSFPFLPQLASSLHFNPNRCCVVS